MRFGLKQLVTPCAIVAAMTLVACGGGDSASVQEELDAQRTAALEALEQAKDDLDAQRQELEDLRAQIADPDSIEVPEGEEAPTVEELQTQAAKLEQDIEAATADLGKGVVDFINEDPPTAGGELNEAQRRAIDIKVHEDIVVAQGWIEKGGDYKRAIQILEAIVPLAPKNQELQDALNHAKDWRFVTEERFSQVKKGQSEQEVREALGPVNLRNVRQYPEKNAMAWFYLKEDGGTAGVYFRERRGKMVVYETDFNIPKNEDSDS